MGFSSFLLCSRVAVVSDQIRSKSASTCGRTCKTHLSIARHSIVIVTCSPVLVEIPTLFLVLPLHVVFLVLSVSSLQSS